MTKNQKCCHMPTLSIMNFFLICRKLNLGRGDSTKLKIKQIICTVNRTDRRNGECACVKYFVYYIGG